MNASKAADKIPVNIWTDEIDSVCGKTAKRKPKIRGKYNEAKSQEDAYVCSYAPMIVVNLTKSQI